MKLFGIFKSNSNVLTNDNLQKLKEETDFKQKEIKKSHKKFNELDKDKKGYVTVDDLVSIPEVDNNPLRYHIAQFMSDNNENEEISFDSFINNLLDFDKDGKISSMDMLINFKLLLGNSLNEEQIKEIVNKTINEYSSDENKEFIYFEDFKKILEES